jgi:hypothetical protein
LTKSSVRKAVVALGAEPIKIDGWTRDGWLLQEDIQAWKSFAADDDRVVLLPYRDPFVSVRRPCAVLARRGTVKVLDAKLKPVDIRDVSGLHHHAIVADGELVGVWEYKPEAECVVTCVWDTDKGLRARVANAAAETERFVRQQLGDAKLSAVDPPERRARRIAFCGG